RGVGEGHDPGRRGRTVRELPAREGIAPVEPPGPVARAAHRALYLKFAGRQAADREDERTQQVITGSIGDRDIVGDGLLRRVGSPAGETDVDERRKVGDGAEPARI